MWIIIAGNPVDGLNFIGPFQTSEEAHEYADWDQYLKNQDWWVVDLIPPTNTEVE